MPSTKTKSSIPPVFTKTVYAFSVAALAMMPLSSEAQVTPVSVSTGGGEATGQYEETVDITPDGRYIAFCSTATDLVAGDTNSKQDCFRRDVQTGVTVRVSVSSGGAEADEDCYLPSISDDGQKVVFTSRSTTFASTVGTLYHYFLRDISSGTTIIVDRKGDGSSSTGGSAGDAWPSAISGDGSFVFFATDALDIANRLGGGCDSQLYRFNVSTQTTSQVSVDNSNQALTCGSNGGIMGNGMSTNSEGSLVAFAGRYILSGSDQYQIFLRNIPAGVTTVESVTPRGTPGNRESFTPFMSSDGRYIAFASASSNLVQGDVNMVADVFRRDRVTQTTIKLTKGRNGKGANGDSNSSSISPDGRFITFTSAAGNLIETEAETSVLTIAFPYIVDSVSGSIARLPLAHDGTPADDRSYSAFLADNGGFIAFTSEATNLMTTPSSGNRQVYRLTDQCPSDGTKLYPGVCGCGVSDIDADNDGTPDCNDGCDEDENKTSAGVCGCGVPDEDTTGSGVLDCQNPGFQTVPSTPVIKKVPGKADSRSIAFQKFGLGVTYFYRVASGRAVLASGETRKPEIVLKDLAADTFKVRYYAMWSGRRTQWSESASFVVSSSKAKSRSSKRKGKALRRKSK